MVATHAPETNLGSGNARKHRWGAAVLAVVVLAGAAMAVPFAVARAHRADVESPPAPPRGTPSPPSVHHHSGGHSALGNRGGLPPLLPSGPPVLRDGQPVRVGDITEGTLRRTAAGWQVLVRWDGRLRPLTTHGPVALGDDSWVSASGLLYTRVPIGPTGRFRVYAWSPRGGSVYSPPLLVATDIGRVCFDPDFTAYGDCSRAP